MAFPNLSRALVLGGKTYDPTRVGLQPPDKLVSALAQPTQPQPRPMIAQAPPRSDMLAKALLAGAHDGGDIETPLELAGRLAQSWAGNYSEERRLREEEEKRQAQLAAEQDRLRQLAESVAAGGYSPEALIATGDPDLMRMGLEAKLRPENTAKPTPYTDLGKIATDVQNGILTEEQGIQEAMKLTMGGGGDPFTLSEGQTRYDAAGNPIAAVPKLADTGNPQLTEIQDPNGPPGKTIKVWSYPDGRNVPAGDAPAPAPPQRPWWAPEGGGVDPAYIEGQEAGRTSITNNVGENGIQLPPPDDGYVYAYKPGPDGGEPVVAMEPDENGYLRPVQVPKAGGKIEAGAAADAAAADVRATQKERTADVVVDSVDRALTDIEANPAGTTGWGGAFLQYLPASEAQAVQQRLLTIKANIGFDRLQLMRESSPTGGAVGQVSNFENQLLQATFGALEQSQKPDELAYNLRRIRSLYSIVTGDSEQTAALAQIGQAVDRGEMTPEQAGQMVEGILSTVPDSGWTTLPGGVRMREVK